MPWRAEIFALKLYIKAWCLSKSAVTQAVSSISYFWFCGIRFDKISEFLDTKKTKIKYKEHATKNGYLIGLIRGPKRPRKGRMRLPDIFQPPPLNETLSHSNGKVVFDHGPNSPHLDEYHNSTNCCSKKPSIGHILFKKYINYWKRIDKNKSDM